METIRRSSLGLRANDKGYRLLIGLFHAHAHNCLCKVSNLGTYVDSQGLEDLEGCEWWFSKSNHLAAATHHASTFHLLELRFRGGGEWWKG